MSNSAGDTPHPPIDPYEQSATDPYAEHAYRADEDPYSDIPLLYDERAFTEDARTYRHTPTSTPLSEEEQRKQKNLSAIADAYRDLYSQENVEARAAANAAFSRPTDPEYLAHKQQLQLEDPRFVRAALKRSVQKSKGETGDQKGTDPSVSSPELLRIEQLEQAIKYTAAPKRRADNSIGFSTAVSPDSLVRNAGVSPKNIEWVFKELQKMGIIADSGRKFGNSERILKTPGEILDYLEDSSDNP